MDSLINKYNPGYFMLADNIDASMTKNWSDSTSYGKEGFKPVLGQSYGSPTEVVFDGAGHTITGLTINRPGSSEAKGGVGLFGNVKGTIANVGMEGGSITGGEATGSLLGVGTKLSMYNCYNTGTVNGSNYVGGLAGELVGSSSYSTKFTNYDNYNTGAVSGSSYVGGLFGGGYYLTTLNSYNTGTVNANGMYIGGVVGYSQNVTFNGCYNTGSVTNNGTGTYAASTGGVLGYCFEKSKITNCYNTGAVTSSSNKVGGVVGQMGSDSVSNTCTLSNCYNTGTVTGAGSGNDAGYVGGVVGYNEYTAVTNVYNTGNVVRVRLKRPNSVHLKQPNSVHLD